MYLKEAQREPCCVDALCAIRVPQPRLRLQPTRPRSLRFLFLPFYATSRRYFSIFCVLFFFFFLRLSITSRKSRRWSSTGGTAQDLSLHR